MDHTIDLRRVSAASGCHYSQGHDFCQGNILIFFIFFCHKPDLHLSSDFLCFQNSCLNKTLSVTVMLTKCFAFYLDLQINLLINCLIQLYVCHVFIQVFLRNGFDVSVISEKKARKTQLLHKLPWFHHSNSFISKSMEISLLTSPSNGNRGVVSRGGGYVT